MKGRQCSLMAGCSERYLRLMSPLSSWISVQRGYTKLLWNPVLLIIHTAKLGSSFSQLQLQTEFGTSTMGQIKLHSLYSENTSQFVVVCASSLQPNSAELWGTFDIHSWEWLLTGNPLCLQGTSSRCCVTHSCSEKGGKTMPKSNCEFISKATNLSRATQEGGVQSFASGVYLNRLRPEVCNQFSACLVFFILWSKVFLHFTCALLGSNWNSRRMFGGAEAAWSLLRSCRHAKAWAGVRWAVTLPCHTRSGSVFEHLQRRKGHMKNNTQQQ